MLLNTFSGDKRRESCEKTKLAVSKCPCLTFSAAMSCLDAKISLVPQHQLIVPLTLLAPATHVRTDKANNPQSHKDTHVNFLSRFFFFQNAEHEYFFFTLEIILAIGKNIFFSELLSMACQIFSLNLLVREYFLVLFDTFPNNTSLAFGDHSCLFRY